MAFDALHTPKTAPTRPEILYVPLCPLTHKLQPGRTVMRCDTRHVAQRRHTAIKFTRNTWAPDGRRSWTYKLCISRCLFRIPYDRPRSHRGARPVPQFISFGHRGASGGPRARRPAAAPAIATRCPRFAPALGLLSRGFRCGSDAAISAAVGRPTTGCPTALSAAPCRASGADVREHACGTETKVAVL